MRKTRLVILPTKCLHQMGFLLLFLSCPVIGDWGRIRPESESSHKAIQIDREGTCGLQRDPPGKLVNFLKENGSKRCQLSEDFGSNAVIEKPMFGEVRRSDERRVDLQRMARQSERRQVTDDRKDVRRAMQRVVDERRDVRRDSQRSRGGVQEYSQTRMESRRFFANRRQENEGAVRRQASVSTRLVQSDNEISARIERERLYQTRRMKERQNDRRIEQQRRSIRREEERTTLTAQESRERENRRLVRSTEGERQDIRREDNRRSFQERSLRRRESDDTVRQTRERSQDRQSERLSLSRREQDNRRSESRRDVENSERRLSQIRKTRIHGGVTDRRMAGNLDNRRGIEKRRFVTVFTKPSEREVRERRVEPLNEKMDRMLEVKSARINAVGKLTEDKSLGNNAEDDTSIGITKWMDLKRLENFKAGDWTTNCVIGAVVYFLSTRQIKAV